MSSIPVSKLVPNPTLHASLHASLHAPIHLSGDEEGSVGATTYQLTATIAPYGGPGRYAAPPARISLKPVGVSPPVLYTGVRGTFTINPDARSGSLSEVLQSQNGEITVNGNWQCP